MNDPITQAAMKAVQTYKAAMVAIDEKWESDRAAALVTLKGNAVAAAKLNSGLSIDQAEESLQAQLRG